MAPQVWRDAEELLRYLAKNYPFDLEDPFEPKVIPANASIPGGDTPLHMVAAWNDVRGIELLAQVGGVIDALGDMSYTPLATAVSSGSVAAAHELLKLGASASIKTEFGQTAHELAMRDGSEEMKEAFHGVAT